MAYYALSSLLTTIRLEFVQYRHRSFLYDYAAPLFLCEKLHLIRQALYSKKFQDGGAVIRDLEIKIRDFALKTEDDIEMQLSNIFQRANDPEYLRNAFWKLHQTFKEVGEGAEELMNSINGTCNEAEGANNDTHPSIHRLKPTSHPCDLAFGRSSRCSREPDENMVGEQHHYFFSTTEKLLLRKNHNRTVIPIVGMAGIGKTALARRVYGDPFVASNFDIKAWATVSHEYNLQQILGDLIHSMTPTVIISEGSTLFQLKEQLYEHLKGKRYFIVFDDIYETQDFNDIQQCFPNEPCGSCILLTTTSVALTLRSQSHTFFKMQFLNKDESWELFRNRLSLERNMNAKFEEIAKHVVFECEGLPRSIVAVAELLSKCNYTLKEWRKIEKEIEVLGPLYRDVQYSRKLTLIYNQLTPHLKVCFLYFALFPKGSDIQAERLLRLWVAEGIMVSTESRLVESRANGHLRDLVARSLLLATGLHFDGLPKAYRMHGALHSFCVREAQKEGLFCAVDTRQCVGWSLRILENSFRWLTLCSHKLDFYVFFGTNNPRSVFFYHGDLEMFEPFKLLRTLDFTPSLILKSVSLRLTDLIFLRYLCVPKWFDGLDEVVRSNPNLQTIIISSVKSKHGAPPQRLQSSVWKLPQLCHLELGNMYTIDPPTIGKKNLDTLSWVSPTHFGEEVHYKFSNLRKLKIFYKGVFEPNGTHRSCINLIIILENIEYLSRLETLKIIVPVGSITLVERPMFPTQLKVLSLRGTNLPMNALRVISQLPFLESLKLENAFYGKVWEVAEGEFIKLKHLNLEARDLERWVADVNQFPNLSHLTLRRCYCLEEIPTSSFLETPELSSITLEQCPLCVVILAKWIELKVRQKGSWRLSVYANGIYQRQKSNDKSHDPNMEKSFDESPKYTNIEEPARED